MRRVLPIKFALIFLLTACVTVNVYFPAAAAEQDAADKIIDNVTAAARRRRNRRTRSSLPPTSRVAPVQRHPILLVAVGRALEMLIPAAQAQGTPISTSPLREIRAVTASMQKRFRQLEKYFTLGSRRPHRRRH